MQSSSQIEMLSFDELLQITKYVLNYEDLVNWLRVYPKLNIKPVKEQLRVASKRYRCVKCEKLFRYTSGKLKHYSVDHAMTVEEIHRQVFEKMYQK